MWRAHQDVCVQRDSDELAHLAVELFSRIARESIRSRGWFSVALSGGTTPRLMYEYLARDQYVTTEIWQRTHVFWSDERFVAPESSESLFGAAQEALLSRVPIPAANVHPWSTIDVTPEDSALQYESLLMKLFRSKRPRFDLILLGMGPDGHTASLFPHQREPVSPSNALAIAVHDSPKPPPIRLSFTYKVINDAQNVIFLIAGSDKAKALQSVLQHADSREYWPARGVKPWRGRLYWLVDEAAAQGAIQADRDRDKRLWHRSIG